MPTHDDTVSRRYDVVVIGAGPAGEAAAELGGALGHSVALVERDTVGGTVITSGGAPTKTFREAAVYLRVEYATIFSALGVPVTVLDNAPRLAAMMDDEISGRLEQILLARGNQVILGQGMVSVRRDGDDLAVQLSDGQRLHPDALLFAAGRSVSTAGLGLEKAGVQVDARGRMSWSPPRQKPPRWR
jgi:pyruvate/2-oxoglutarate dehydrogenase complex dihydrolipoamide dehydrogenase (E3) component